MTYLKNYKAVLLLGGVFLFSFPGCTKKDENSGGNIPTMPVLTTTTVTAIFHNSAVSGGAISSDGGAAVTVRGICWSLTSLPQIAGSHTVDGSGTGTFTSQMTGLIQDTLYYARAYAVNSAGAAYGNIQSFRTPKIIVDSVSDADSNLYHVIQIGQQFWLLENLRATHYRNGDPVNYVTNDNQWKLLTTGAYCKYENLQSLNPGYGNLYNWHALSDIRGICPTGWHIPFDEEWAKLGDFLGGNNDAGGKLKSTGTIEGGSGLWYDPNAGATNSSGFTGLPGGYRINYGTFYSLGNVGYFWSATDTASANAWNYILDANNGELNRNFNLKANGFSVRCCKD